MWTAENRADRRRFRNIWCNKAIGFVKNCTNMALLSGIQNTAAIPFFDGQLNLELTGRWNGNRWLLGGKLRLAWKTWLNDNNKPKFADKRFPLLGFLSIGLWFWQSCIISFGCSLWAATISSHERRRKNALRQPD
jgi:hypothetical protein